MKFPLCIIIFIQSIPFISLDVKTLSQCVGSDLILRPEEYADDQEFFDFKILKVSEPKRSIATWPNGLVGERVKIIDEGYQNATVTIQHLQPSDAGIYVIDVVLKSSKMLTQQFTVQIDESCTKESTVLPSQIDKMTKEMTTLTTTIGSETSQKPNNDNNSQDSNNNSQDANNSSHDANNNSQDSNNNSQGANNNSQGANNNSQDANNNSQDANATEKRTLIVVNNIYDIVIAILGIVIAILVLLVLLVLLVAIVIIVFIVKYWKRCPCCKSSRERTPQDNNETESKVESNDNSDSKPGIQTPLLEESNSNQAEDNMHETEFEITSSSG